MTRLPLLLGVAVLAGCGGGDTDPAAVLSQTAANLGKIRSAESMRPLPILDVEYTQLANGQDRKSVV